MDKWSELSQKQTERILEKMSYLESRVTKGLANLLAGVDARCPRIVSTVPLSNQDGVTSNPMMWPRTEVQIFFVCQHSSVVVKEASITARVTKPWMKSVAPAIGYALLLLKIAAAEQSICT